MVEHDCEQDERIARIEESVRCMDNKVDGLNTNQQKILTWLDIYMKKIDEHDAILKGENGNVGVVAQVVQAITILTELNTALKGREDKPGLIAAIDTLVRRNIVVDDEKVWLTRLIIGTLITWVIGIAVVLFK
jgi:hypothetical protein